MGGIIQKNKLSEIAIYYGDVSMPKGFEIDRNKLQEDILTHQIQDCPFPFSREWDKLLNIDPVDLRNSPDYTMLYGVNVKECSVRIHYDDNRRKGRSWDIPLKNNQFIIFPSTNMYYITNNQKDSLNFILTSTYEYI